MTIGRAELVEEIHLRTGLSRVKAKPLMEAVIKVMFEALARGESIDIPAFGNFHVLPTPAKRTCLIGKGYVDVPERKRIWFRSSIVIDNLVNQ